MEKANTHWSFHAFNARTADEKKIEVKFSPGNVLKRKKILMIHNGAHFYLCSLQRMKKSSLKISDRPTRSTKLVVFNNFVGGSSVKAHECQTRFCCSQFYQWFVRFVIGSSLSKQRQRSTKIRWCSLDRFATRKHVVQACHQFRVISLLFVSVFFFVCEGKIFFLARAVLFF